MGRIAVAACALAVAAGATACGERSEPTGANVRLYPVMVSDAEDHATRLEREPRRVVALTQATADIVRALGAGDRLTGPPQRYFAQAGNLLATRVRRAHPDLVLAAPDTDGVQSRVSATGAPVFLAPDGSIEEVEQAITRIGLLLGRPVQARLAVHRIEVTRAKIGRELADTRALTVFVDTGFFSTVPDQSLIGDLIRQANGTNVAGTTGEAGPFDLVQLAQLDPAVYLATSDSQTTLRDLRRDPRTRRLTAVKNGRFAIVDARLLEPGPDVGEGLTAIARALHPDAVR